MSAPRPPGPSLPGAIGRLIIARERLLLAAVALVVIDLVSLLPVVVSLDRLTTFRSVVSNLLGNVDSDGLRTAIDGSTGSGIALAASLIGGSLAGAILRCSYLQALVVRSGLPRPQRSRVLALAALNLAGSGALTVAGLRGDSSALPLLVWIALLVATLYADLAIALDGLSLPRALARSASTLRARMRPSVAVIAAALWFQLVLTALFGSSLLDEATPLSLTLFVVVVAVGTFVSDCALVTIYRSTPLPGEDQQTFG